MTPIDIGSRRELLLDDHLVESLRGEVAMRLHLPTPKQIVFPLVSDHVTNEKNHGLRAGHAYMTVLHDGGRYRMYYGVSRNDYLGKQRWLHYAESANGIHWETPSLGLVDYLKSTDNNVIGMADVAPFIDAKPSTPPERRYKGILTRRKADGEHALYAVDSADGLRWDQLSPDEIITDGKFDSQNLAFWDAERKQYRAYWRDFFAGPENKRYRGIRTATSDNFVDWTPAEWLEFPGATTDELYTNQIIPYYRAPHILVGFPSRYVERPWSEAIAALPEVERRQAFMERGKLPRLGTALTDTLFMSSRDGVSFNLHGEAFIPPGLRPRDNWVYGDNYANWGIVETASEIAGAPPELTWYVSEGSRRDHYSKEFRRYTLRIDGFVSAAATRRGGELITRPLIFSGGELRVNLAASAAGFLRVELQDLHGQPLPGFALADSVEVLGDDLERRVQWRGSGTGPSLAAIAGTPLRVRFELADADLYAFQFRDP
jgi:hypothetical protein